MEIVVNITKAYTKTLKTSHGLRVLHAALPMPDIYLAGREGSI